MTISTINQYFSENQPLTTILDTGTDLTNVSELKIKLTEVDSKSSYEYDAEIYDSNNETVTGDIPGGVLKDGTWAIQASATFDGDSYATLGKPVYIQVNVI